MLSESSGSILEVYIFQGGLYITEGGLNLCVKGHCNMGKTITITICEETHDIIEALILLGANPEQNKNVVTINYSLIVEHGSPDTYFGHYGNFSEVVYYNNIRNIFETSLLFTLVKLSKKGLVLLPSDLEIPNGFKESETEDDYGADDEDTHGGIWLDDDEWLIITKTQDSLMAVCCNECKAKMRPLLLV